MKKADCRKMKKLVPTDKIRKLAAVKPNAVNPYTSKPREGLYRYYLRAITENDMVKISIFDADWIKENISESKFDIFIDVSEARYISLEKKKDGNELKWRTATISFLINDDYWSSARYRFVETIYSNKDTDARIRKALNSRSGNSYRAIQQYQSDILDERIRKKEEAECAEYDRDMKPIKGLPKDFENWIRENAIQNHYIFYQYRKKVTSGFCSCCNKEVRISGAKHNKKGRCPVCHSAITFKSSGKIQTLGTDYVKVQVVQAYPSGYVIRHFRCRMYYQNSRYWSPQISIYEYRRYIYGEQEKMYVYELYKNKAMRWIKAVASDYFYLDGFIYPRGLKLLPEYDSLKLALDKHTTISLAKWSNYTVKGSAFEKLLKAGFIELFNELFDYGSYRYASVISKNETELHKVLRLDKMRMKRLKALHGRVRELEWLQEEKKANTVWPDEMIRLFSDGGYYITSFDFIRDKMTYPQIFEYLKKQYTLYGYTWDYTIGCWRDYMDMAAKLKVPLDIERNYKPKDIKTAHNEALDMLQGKDIEKEARQIDRKWKKLKKIYPKLKKYEYKDGKYQIIAPERTADIVREGMILKHCVHSCDFYFNRISTDESYILFLRKADSPTVPYYTLEVEPGGNIRQKRTTGDRQNKDFDEAKQFLAKWQRAIQKKITKKDRELGEKSNSLRIQELAELRKKGNRVWHGVLQGQLLADVLEADFMPVIDETGKAV